MRWKRSVMAISPVGTSSLTSPKALAPESLVRVLTAIVARSSSTGAPLIAW